MAKERTPLLRSATKDFGALPFHIERIAWAKANEKITSHPRWPLFLPPDAKQMAEDIFEEIKDEMSKQKYDYEKAGVLEKSDIEAPSSASA